MPDTNKALFKYSHYFTKETPEYWVQIIILLVVSAFFGLLIGITTHYSNFTLALSAYYLSGGILVIALPAILTVALVKGMQRNMKLKHISLIAIIGAVSYSIFMLVGAEVFVLSNIIIPFFVILLVGDASLFGFWFIINRFVIINKKKSLIIASVQPVLNMFFYVPLHYYLFSLSLPVSIAFTKLFAGMAVFLVVGYLFIYAVDRPLKKSANVSGVIAFSILINQWLFNISSVERYYSNKFGVDRDIKVEMFLLYDSKWENPKGKKLKAVFVKPQIHYGPFAGAGGSEATVLIGDNLEKKYNAAPIILHGAVNAAYNPVSTAEILRLNKAISGEIEKGDGSEQAYGWISSAKSGRCRAINLKIGNCNLITLSKAPYVTEDIANEAGEVLERHAEACGNANAIIIDAHNSRIESAGKEELRGIYSGSRYMDYYKRAIAGATLAGKGERVKFGVSYKKLWALIDNPKDLGKGYSSVCVFEAGKKRFCMVYFDANNMLPSFRVALLKHISSKYGLEAEAYTTDTHSVNTIALTASNVLGRYTDVKKVIGVIDAMISEALSNMSVVSSRYSSFTVKGFRVWGEHTEEQMVSASRDVINILKHVMPFVIAGAFIIAAWLVYFV